MTTFFVTIEGAKQGTFKGESALDRRPDALPGVSFHYAVTSPRDVATGQATGKRQHQPIVFVKEWGAASPQLFQALVTNEVLTSVVFEFVKTNDAGEQHVHQTIRLTNASISQIEQFVNGDPEPPPVDPRALEKVSLTFQRIELENTDGKTSAIDEIRGRL